MKTKKITIYGFFLGLALIFSYVEQLLPISFGVPGIKIGLANIITMLLLYFAGARGAILLSAIRIILAGILFGSVFSMVYSGAGAICSIAAMTICMKTDKFGTVGISLVGGIFHNIGQILLAAVILETAALVYYLPVLILAGLAAGILVGILSGILIKRLGSVIRQYLG